MKLWQKLLLAVTLVLLAAVIVLTWGSLGSAVLVFCLIMMGAALLYQHFVTNQDSDDFDYD